MSSVISTARVIETPAKRSEDMVRAVRAVFSSFAKLPIIGIRMTAKSIYFAINLARKKKYRPKAPPIKTTKVRIKLLEKKLPKKTRIRVERGKTTPSSL